MDNAVALAAIGLASTTVVGLIWLAKFVANTLGKDLKEHTQAALHQTESNKELAKASRQQTKASGEVLSFMKNLNGKLAKATIQTISEQNVENQVVTNQEIKK